jgi:Protein of unknown function (DUF2786)
MSDTDKIVDKIKKLLRLGRGSNHAAEAQAAIEKAYELASGAGISIDGIDIDKDTLRITHEEGGVRRCVFARRCAHGILKRHFSVLVLASSERGCIYVGPSVNIAIAKHVEAFLIRECASSWSAFSTSMRSQRITANKRKTYELNFFAGVDSVLRMRPIRNDRDEIQKAIDKYTEANFSVVTTKLDRPTREDRTVAANAYLHGLTTNVSRPVEGSVNSRMIC